MKRFFIILCLLVFTSPVFAQYLNFLDEESIEIVAETYHFDVFGYQYDGGFVTDDYSIILEEADCPERNWYIMRSYRNDNYDYVLYFCLFAIIEDEETHDKHDILLCVKEGIGESITFMIPRVLKKP